MYDIKWIRENPQAFDRGLQRRGLPAQSRDVLALDERRRCRRHVVHPVRVSRLQFGQHVGGTDMELIDGEPGHGFDPSIFEEVSVQSLQLRFNRNFRGGLQVGGFGWDCRIREELYRAAEQPAQTLHDSAR